MDCHTPEAHWEGGNLYQMMQEAKPVTRGLRDATMMNVVRKHLIQVFPKAEITYGNITKADREAILLPKSHANDAIVVATKGNPVILTDPAGTEKETIPSRGNATKEKKRTKPSGCKEPEKHQKRREISFVRHSSIPNPDRLHHRFYWKSCLRTDV